MSKAHALRRFTRHDFNRAAWLKARRSGLSSPAPAFAISRARPTPPHSIKQSEAPAPRRVVKLDLVHAPSSMELRAASWGQPHA